MQQQQMWRVSPVVQVLGIIAFIVEVIAVSKAVLSPFSLGVKFAYAAAAVGFAVFLYVSVFRPSVTLTDSELVVRNRWRTHRIAVRDIVRADAGYSGIAVQTGDGHVVRVWAVQKPNLARWMGWRTRADLVAERIIERVTAAAAASATSKGEDPAQPTTDADVRPPSQLRLRVSSPDQSI